MLKPEFPFLKDQLILSSERVVLHTKSDGIFLLGKGAVSLSSPATINLDSNEKVLINSPKIELGYRAELEGEPVLLGHTLNRQLTSLLFSISQAACLMQQVSGDEGNIPASFENIASAGKILEQQANELLVTIGNRALNPALSTTTYTKR